MKFNFINNVDTTRFTNKLNLKLYYKYIDCPDSEKLPEKCDVIFVDNPESYMYKNKRILKSNTQDLEEGKKRYLAMIKTTNYFNSDKVSLWYRFLIVEKVVGDVIYMKLLNIYEVQKMLKNFSKNETIEGNNQNQ